MIGNTNSTGSIAVYRPDLMKIDLMNGREFQAGIQANLCEGSRLVVDLGNVRFIDSSGLGKLVAALRSYREVGGDIRICSVQPSVMTLFEMVRLVDIVAIDADADQAVAAFSKIGADADGNDA